MTTVSLWPPLSFALTVIVYDLPAAGLNGTLDRDRTVRRER